MKIRNMKKMTTMALALCATMGLGGCDMTVPDLNNPGVESIRDNPTRSSVLSATTGLLIGHRNGKGAQNGLISQLGVLGRESYILDTADPRYVSELLSGEHLDPGSPAFGGTAVPSASSSTWKRGVQADGAAVAPVDAAADETADGASSRDAAG